MGKTRDLFKKIRDIKGAFYTRMDIIKHRKLTEAKELKKRQKEYIDKLYKKGLNDLDSHDGTDTHLGPDILQFGVKQALGSITKNKASGDDRISAEKFKILKSDVKVLHSMCQKIWKTQHWLQDQRRSVFILSPKKGNAKDSSNYHTIVLSLHASMVML